MLKKVVTAVALVSAFGMVSSSAMAAKSLDSGFYVDGNLGWSIATGNWKSFIKDSGGTTSGFAWGVGAGYKFMPNLAVDFDYYRMVLEKGTNKAVIVNNVSHTFDDGHLNAFVLSAKGILPVGDGFSVYGKLGPAFMNASNDYNGQTGNTEVTLYVGLGAEYNFTQNMYVGVLGSYFMKRESMSNTTTTATIDDNFYPAFWSVTANFGYMF